MNFSTALSVTIALYNRLGMAILSKYNLRGTQSISHRWLSCCAPQLMPIYADILNVSAVASPVSIQLIYFS